MELQLNRITIDLSTTGAEASVYAQHEERGYVTRGTPENRHVDTPRIQAAREELIAAVEEAVAAGEADADEPLPVTRAIVPTEPVEETIVDSASGLTPGMAA